MAGANLPSFHGIIGRSAAMQALFREMEDLLVEPPGLIRGGPHRQEQRRAISA
jgi:hypothetical protein